MRKIALRERDEGRIYYVTLARASPEEGEDEGGRNGLRRPPAIEDGRGGRTADLALHLV